MIIPDDLFYNDPDDRTGPPLTAQMIEAAEQKLGYRLPADYLALLQVRNGGYIQRDSFPFTRPSNSSEQYALVGGISGIGGRDGIDSEYGSQYLIQEWSYPQLGIVIDSDGHTAVMLDYRETEPSGEPAVVYIDTDVEGEPLVIPLAANFGEFIQGLIATD
jgi:hypothetical protein